MVRRRVVESLADRLDLQSKRLDVVMKRMTDLEKAVKLFVLED